MYSKQRNCILLLLKVPQTFALQEMPYLTSADLFYVGFQISTLIWTKNQSFELYYVWEYVHQIAAYYITGLDFY